MGLERERTALSIESMSKSGSEVQMEQTTEIGSKECSEPSERNKVSEKNGE